MKPGPTSILIRPRDLTVGDMLAWRGHWWEVRAFDGPEVWQILALPRQEGDPDSDDCRAVAALVIDTDGPGAQHLPENYKDMREPVVNRSPHDFSSSLNWAYRAQLRLPTREGFWAWIELQTEVRVVTQW